MSDFIFNNYDYIDYIRSAEDLKLFQRMVELEPELEKPASECIAAVIEVTNNHRKLVGLKEIKWLLAPDPTLN